MADFQGYKEVAIEASRKDGEGIEGSKGGLSAENYISITATSRATATRDLQQLVEIGSLARTGERRHTRYTYNFKTDQSATASRDDIVEIAKSRVRRS
jgi:Fic family protein